jgi:hypothetical protein
MCFSELIFTLLTQLLVLQLYLTYLKWRLTIVYSAEGGISNFIYGRYKIHTTCNAAELYQLQAWNFNKHYEEFQTCCDAF